MDIEKLIADLQEISQKNSISHYKRDRCATAATALSALQAKNEKLRAELEQVIQTVHGDCDYCANRGNCLDRPCKGCKYFAAKELVTGDYWEWHGPQKED